MSDCNLDPRLSQVLAALEERLGVKLMITSGYRSLEHNAQVGGVTNSEHTCNPAQGVDVACPTGALRFKLVKAALEMGIKRIGIGKTFVHVGIAEDKPQDVIWHYYS